MSSESVVWWVAFAGNLLILCAAVYFLYVVVKTPATGGKIKAALLSVAFAAAFALLPLWLLAHMAWAGTASILLGWLASIGFLL
ncbi:MAG: hypothetical protein N3A02_06855, partial [Rectinema sp.]|nr:hypothetical protein [Rectinema sp.]